MATAAVLHPTSPAIRAAEEAKTPKSRVHVSEFNEHASSKPEHTKWLPFHRSDKYGELGFGPLHWTEYIRLTLLSITVLPVKFISFMLVLVFYWLVCQLAWLLPETHRQDTVAALGKKCSRAVLFTLGFINIYWHKHDALSTTGAQAEPQYGAVMANHVSTCDILLMMSRYFPSFLSKATVANYPFIGKISQYMQCVYVDLQAKANNQSTGMAAFVKERMLAVMRPENKLRAMAVFPEGTTSNGKCLLPFKTGGFLAGVPIKPHIIKYSTFNVSPAYDSIDLLRLFYLVMVNPFHSVTVIELPVYVPSQAEQQDPKLFADNVRKYMLAHSDLQPCEGTYKDQLEYMAHLATKTGKSKKVSKGE